MRQRFSALRSREKQGANPQIEQARDKFTPAHKKRPLGATSDEETPTKTSRRRRSKVVAKKISKSKVKVDDDEDSSSPEPTLRLPHTVSNNTTTPTPTSTSATNVITTPPVHNTRAASRSSLTVTKSQVEKNITSIVDLAEYQAQPTIRISDSILKIINDENEKKIIIPSSDSE